MSTEQGRNSFQEAADRAGVPLAEFKEWLLLNVQATHTRWTNWNSGAEPVPERLVIQFLREKLVRIQAEQADRVLSGSDADPGILQSVREDLDRILHSTSPLRGDTIEHLRRQLHLLAEAIGHPPGPGSPVKVEQPDHPPAHRGRSGGPMKKARRDAAG